MARTILEFQQEYTQLCAKLGHAYIQKKGIEDEIPRLFDACQAIILESAAINAETSKAAAAEKKSRNRRGMIREIRRLEINEGIHLEGIGIIASVLPMALKHVDIRMYYDTTYPHMIMIEAKGNTHFISLSTVKSGTFDSEPNGNVI